MSIGTPFGSSNSNFSVVEADFPKMKVVYFSNEFPHDDLSSLLRELHVHSRDRSHPTLAQFLDEATLAIRDEVRQLPTALRASVPPFETVIAMAEFTDLRKGPLSAAVDSVLLAVVQLGTLICYHEDNVEQYDIDSVNTLLAGLGIGLLTTAAVSLARTLSDLPLAGAQVARQAFRLGVLVDEVSQNLQPRDWTETGTPDSWAYVLPDVTADKVQTELDAVYSKEQTPASGRVFISALSATSVTINGPPARLKSLLLKADFFRDRKHVALPVFTGLCHAGHIYSQGNVYQVTRTRSMEALNSKLAPRIRVFSTNTGAPFPAKDATGLFEHIIGEILMKSIQWDRVVEGVVAHARNIEATQSKLVVFRISLPIHDLSAALKTLSGLETTTEELIPWVHEKKCSSEPGGPRGSKQDKIAIVGMSCRMPGGATDTEKFWELLEAGLDVHRKIPADRFDVDSHHDLTGKRMNTSHTAYGCFIDEPALFDAPFFNMSPREAQQTDPMQRLAIVTAYEALERAGYVANRTASSDLRRIGTFYGQASDDYREVSTAQEISTYFIPGGCRAFGPGRINYFFKFSGPSYSIDTACSSSLATIQTACTSLWAGETDMAVAGGTNVLTNSDAFAGLSHGHFLTKTPNACKTWDERADGYCRADAVASLVLKRLEGAEADNDNILGVIVGSGTNHSAEAVSITHPHAGHQAYLGNLVCNRAAVDPLDVSYVEMHGTGTQAGDTEEMQSVANVFAPLTRRRSSKIPLYIGAVKSNVGHSEAAAGVTALVKVLLMLQKNAIPPHVGIKNRLNPKFKDLDKRNIRIPYNKTEWPHAAGGNTSIAIEEAPVHKAIGTDSRKMHVVAVSAKSKILLKGNLERLLAYLDKKDEAQDPYFSLANLSYSTTARRYHHNHRVAITASSVEHVRKQLTSALASADSQKPIPTIGPPSIAFAFTGQGSSFKSYNLSLYHDAPYFRSQIKHLDELAQGQGFPSFIPVLDGSHPQDHGHSPVMTQLALVCTEIALAKYWASLDVKPDVVIGHSLGEYAALHVAGVLSASDAIFLVGQRAQLLEQRCQAGSHKMVAVRASVAQIEASAGNMPYEIACINGPKETVLSGPLADMDALILSLEADGHRCFRLDVAFAFHSAQTDPVLDEFELIASSGVLFQAPQLPIISPLLGKVICDDKTVNASYMRRATRESVNFLEALQTAYKIGTVDDGTAWIEIGPHPVGVGFVKTTLGPRNTAVPSLRRGEDDWVTMSQSLAALHCAGVQLSWDEFHKPFGKALKLLDLPTYAWNDKSYWIQYNGHWALTKGNTFYDAEKGLDKKALASTSSHLPNVSSLSTSTVQRIIEESFNGTAGTVVMESDLTQSDFRAAAWGHKMNGCGVVTSSIHADIAYTLGEYLYKKLKPRNNAVSVDITNLHVVKGLVANNKTTTPQLIRVSLTTADIDSNTAQATWYTVDNTTGACLTPSQPLPSPTVPQPSALSSWLPTTHLILSRIDQLAHLAATGIANRFNNNMAYLLFANNLVDYHQKYRGMQSVVLHDLEAYADVQLSTEKGGTWTVPPYFIDSVAHLAGFVMNVSDAIDTKANYCVTPGWASMRFAKPLVAGAKCRSYVKMIPTKDDPTVYLGDVYILQENKIIGMVGAIQFRRYPRILLHRFFPAPDDPKNGQKSAEPVVAAPAVAAKQVEAIAKPAAAARGVPGAKPAVVEVKIVKETPVAVVDAETTSAKAIQLIADEAALEMADLTDEADFASLGIDSLMSLVIAEKFREQLGVVVSGSLFLEYPTIGDLRNWLEEYYN